MIIKTIVAFVATFTFSILFKAPTKHLLFCGIVGVVAYFTSALLRFYGLNVILATFLASVLLTIFARFFSYQRQAPATIFLIPGIFPLVPGTGIYYTASYIFANDYTAAMTKGVETMLIAGSLVVGLLFGMALPKKWFTLFNRSSKT